MGSRAGLALIFSKRGTSMRQGRWALFVALALAHAAPAAAQNQGAPAEPPRQRSSVTIVAAPRTPSPTDGMTRSEQIAYFIKIAENRDSAPPDRENAMKRLRFLYLEQRDPVRSDQWIERRNAYVLELERDILAGPPLPASPPVCTEPPTPGKCGYGSIPRNFDAYWRYTILAEAAEQHRDYARVIAMREPAIVFMHGSAPMASHWLGLAREASKFAQHDAARRLCAIVSDNAVYSRQRDQGRKCTADISFAADDWAGWLAYYQPISTGPNSRDPGKMVRYCVAATRANLRNVSAQACDWAAESVSARDAAEREDAATAAAKAKDEATRKRILAGEYGSIKSWLGDKPLFDSAIANCRAAQQTPDASKAKKCGGAPDGEFWRGSLANGEGALEFERILGTIK
jgi:hypothetical protein